MRKRTLHLSQRGQVPDTNLSRSSAPGLRKFRAPARINIIGEHTDYNGGLVLPMTTALYVRVEASARPDRRVSVTSSSFSETKTFDLDRLAPREQVDWIDYVRGVAAELEATGIELCGADLLIDSEIPQGAGLSSSAALELAVARALLGVSAQDVAADRLARICQRAEHRYAKVMCGIMDQFTIACAQRGHALLLDCDSLDTRQLRLPDRFGFLVTDSGVRHRLPDGHYNNRASECAAALDMLSGESPGIESLCDVDASMLERSREKLGDTLYRRVRHVLTENARVKQAVDALQQESAEDLGALINQSHASLRDDFAVSCAAIEQLVELLDNTPGIYGSRMIGGGFGGCVLSLLDAESLATGSQHIRHRLRSALGRDPWMHIASAASPAEETVA